MDGDDFVNKSFYLFVFSSDIRNFFDDFLHLGVYHNLFFDLGDLVRLRVNSILNYYLFEDSRYLNYLFHSLSHRHQLLHDSVNGN
mgnify:CR=1 FL=1